MSILPSYIANLSNIMDRIYNQADHAPSTSAESKWRVRQFINRAMHRLVNDAPWLFEETFHQTYIEPNVFPSHSTDTISISTDAWVMRLDLPIGDANATVWDEGRDWDARWLAVKTPDGAWQHIRIRETFAGGAGSLVRFVVLERPWPNVSDSGMEWAVVNSETLLPADLVELRSMRIFSDGGDYRLDVMSLALAERASVVAAETEGLLGQPQAIYRQGPRSLKAPNFRPGAGVSVEAASDTSDSIEIDDETGGAIDIETEFGGGIGGGGGAGGDDDGNDIGIVDPGGFQLP